MKFESLRITSAIIILIRTYAYAPWVSLLSPVVLAVGSDHAVWHPSVLAAYILTQQSKFTKSAERSHDEQTITSVTGLATQVAITPIYIDVFLVSGWLCELKIRNAYLLKQFRE